MLRIEVEKAMTLLEWIGAASHTAGWKREAEWPTVPIGFHFVRSLEENLFVLQQRGSSSVNRTTVLVIAPYNFGLASADQAYRDDLDVNVLVPVQGDCA